jgi:transcriptional regulator with XRE-family HTH domain
MPKTIHRNEYRVLLRLLKETRERAGLTQAQCAEALGRHQSFVSDVERGVIRLDVVQLLDLCRVVGVDLIKFIKQFQIALRRNSG